MGTISSILATGVLIVFLIYWFELDEKFIKGFEPVFRKLTDRNEIS